MKVSKYWKIAEFPKKSIEMNHRKTFYKAQTASHLRKFFSLPQPIYHQIESYYLFETKIFLGRYTEIYRYLLTKFSKKVALGSQEMVQCKSFFWDQTEHVCWKIRKLRKFFGCVLGAHYFHCQNSRFVKWVMFFERNCIVKWVIFFASFYWLWDFLLENLE